MAAPERQQPGQRTAPPWSVVVARPFGIPVVVSASWLFFLVFITVQFAPVVASAVPGIGGARFVVAGAFGVFLGVSILLHEIAHCIVARRLSIPVETISLSFLTGHSALGAEPANPRQAAAVAAAGPLTNVAIGFAAWAVYRQAPGGSVGSVLAAALALSNIVVGLYNLLPGLPLDGGQLLRALIWAVRGDVRAGTVGAAWAGRAIAVGTALLAVVLVGARAYGGLAGAFWAVLVAAMLWVSSTAVLRQQAVRDRLPAISARQLARPYVAVTSDVPLAEAVRRAQQVVAQGIVIIDGHGQPIAVVNETKVNATPAARRPWIDVGSMARQVAATELIDVQLDGEALIRRLQAVPATEYIVIDGDAIYGVLAAADVAAMMSGRRRPRRRSKPVPPDNLRA